MNTFDAKNDPSFEPGSIPPVKPTRRQGGIVGAIILFLLYALLGSIIGVVYILAVDIMPSIYICGALAVLYGVLMARITSLFKNKTSRLNMLIAVLAGVLIVTYVKWNAFFALNDTRFYLWDYNEDFDLFTHFSLLLEMFRLFLVHPEEFINALTWYNEFGTWSYGENATANVTGMFLALIWLGEFLIITVPSLFEAFGFSKRAAKPAPLPDEIWSGPVPGNIVPENTAAYAEVPADAPYEVLRADEPAAEAAEVPVSEAGAVAETTESAESVE